VGHEQQRYARPVDNLALPGQARCYKAAEADQSGALNARCQRIEPPLPERGMARRSSPGGAGFLVVLSQIEQRAGGELAAADLD
jgi:hypothetical protein